MLIVDMEHANEESSLAQGVRDWARKLRIQMSRLCTAALGRQSRPPTEAHREPEDPGRIAGLIL
jgi:hypothetical protein